MGKGCESCCTNKDAQAELNYANDHQQYLAHNQHVTPSGSQPPIMRQSRDYSKNASGLVQTKQIETPTPAPYGNPYEMSASPMIIQQQPQQQPVAVNQAPIAKPASPPAPAYQSQAPTSVNTNQTTPVMSPVQTPTKKSNRGNAGNLTDETMKIVRLQCMIRGFLERKKYRVLYNEQQMKHTLYFKKDELMETLKTGQIYDAKAPLQEVRITYQSTGSMYEGQMRGGFRHGKGKMTWTDGAVYDGMWEEGFATGKGIFFHKDGDTYDGEWRSNKCNGFGKYENKNKAKYEGFWKNDLQSGHGTEIWPEGSKYEGKYEDGKKQGFGKYTWADGSLYSGDWYDNKINGIGQYKWKDGRKYFGYWKDNDMHGHGIYVYSDGVTYEGQYVDDKKTGYGFYYWTDGRKYEGWWYKGKQHGLGIFKDPKKQKVKFGVWEQGKRMTWFEDKVIEQINMREYNYQDEFTEESSVKYCQPEATFLPPEGFTDEINNIKQIFNLQ